MHAVASYPGSSLHGEEPGYDAMHVVLWLKCKKGVDINPIKLWFSTSLCMTFSLLYGVVEQIPYSGKFSLVQFFV